MIPNINEQLLISSFLDRRCGEIDSVISNIQSQIETLEEYKRSVITEAVTKGIRKSNVSTDTAIPWIKQMPTRWRLSRIKYEIIPLSRSVKGTDGVITCFRDGQVTLRKYRREEGFTISFTENGYQGVEEGDLVIHGMDTFAGAIGCSECRGKCTPVVHVCKTTGNNRYFMYYLRSLASNEVLWFYANGVRVRSSDFRNFSNLGKFTISVPPISEQNEIVEYLDSKCAEIDSIILFCRTAETLSGVSVLRQGGYCPRCFMYRASYILFRRLMCRRELLPLGVGVANSTSIFGHKNSRQTGVLTAS